MMFFGEYIIMMYYQTNEKRRREGNISVCVSHMVHLVGDEGLPKVSNGIKQKNHLFDEAILRKEA